MGPARTTKAVHAAQSSSSLNSGRSRSHSKAKAMGREPAPATIPGVQRLKSSIRQTKRLLSKNLAADVRVETERRLNALESDLIRAESAKKERSLAVRYHKIKFFERQKVTRRLNQTKKLLSEDALSSSSSKRKLEHTLTELRVDLNYIIHYSKTKKYISLFPPEARHHESSSSRLSVSEQTKTDVDRQEVRSWIRECMQKGQFSTEPEMVVQKKEGRRTVSGGWDSRGEGGKMASSLEDKRGGGGGDAVDEDEFFGEDDESGGDEEV